MDGKRRCTQPHFTARLTEVTVGSWFDRVAYGRITIGNHHRCPGRSGDTQGGLWCWIIRSSSIVTVNTITLAPQLNRAQLSSSRSPCNLCCCIRRVLATFPRNIMRCAIPWCLPGRAPTCWRLPARQDIVFPAINPQPLIYDTDSHYKTLREFSGAALKQHPPSTPADEQWAEKLRDLTGKIAEQMNITVEALQSD